MITNEAKYYEKRANEIVQCQLCPHHCKIKPGRRGLCGVRKNNNGVLIAETKGQICSAGFDPIEKKPLYHFHPGKIIFSVGSIGCNLKCKFCQNWEISQTQADEFRFLKDYTPGQIADTAYGNRNNSGIAYTYNEPTVWFEYMLEIADKAAKHGLKNVMVTNGYINSAPLGELLNVIDAFSVDLKAFTDRFYRKLTSSSLEPVLASVRQIAREKKHLELTNLVIPGENDDEKDFREMIKCLHDELGPDTVLHLSAYYPKYKLKNPPTSRQKLEELYHIAKEKLYYTYTGNMNTSLGRDTLCQQCGELLVSRKGYHTMVTGLDENACCLKCGFQCPVVM